jgi:hypothetical protein
VLIYKNYFELATVAIVVLLSMVEGDVNGSNGSIFLHVDYHVFRKHLLETIVEVSNAFPCWFLPVVVHFTNYEPRLFISLKRDIRNFSRFMAHWTYVLAVSLYSLQLFTINTRSE